MPRDETERAEAAMAMHHLLSGGWVAEIIHTAAQLGLADHFGEEARDVASLASATATHAPSLSRLLRALAAVGVVRETEDLRYTLTSLGATLRTDQPGSMRAWARFVLGDEMLHTWRALPQTVRTGDIGFRHAFGTDQRSYLATHPDFATLFNAAMLSATQGINAEIGAHYPFGNFGWIVDVGGGIGTLLLPILDRHPEMRGTIFEFPDVAVQARERIAAAGLAARCDAVEGDARITVPAGADAYVMKAVLHGRTDDEAGSILHNCRHAMSAHARLLIIERLLPERIDPNDAIGRENLLSDINMMVAAGGRERTEEEYRGLLVKAGLRLTRVIRTPRTSAIIEAEPA
ncbi:MAG TPA: methyltransferase [Stellaceae bacterium]|nr:methyltransferase [Stellaceae bacterium]